jgi:hypothetical protein
VYPEFCGPPGGRLKRRAHATKASSRNIYVVQWHRPSGLGRRSQAVADVDVLIVVCKLSLKFSAILSICGACLRVKSEDPLGGTGSLPPRLQRLSDAETGASAMQALWDDAPKCDEGAFSAWSIARRRGAAVPRRPGPIEIPAAGPGS